MTDEQRREPDVTHVEVVDVVEIDVTVTELVDGELIDGELGDPDDAGHASALGTAHAATSIVAGEAFEAANPEPADLDGDVIDVIDVIDEVEEVELVDELDGDDGEHDAVLVLDTWQIELPATGDATVDAALARLAEVEGLPTTEHADVYEAVHARLQDALADLDPELTVRRRLDAELVHRHLARSREHAATLIAGGRVRVHGTVATKAATQVDGDAPVVVDDGDDPGYASRGAHKLVGALDVFVPRGLQVEGRRALDAGASTGGFTDVLLRRGAREVVAVDVGYGQLVWRLQDDPRVTVLDRTNVRALTLEDIGAPAELVVGDLSFISLTLVLPALVACATPDADLLLMVKPQFEVGRERLGSGGVVRDPVLRADAVATVAGCAAGLGLGLGGVTASPLPGPAGNVEYFVWLQAGAPPWERAAVERAVEEGPS